MREWIERFRYLNYYEKNDSIEINSKRCTDFAKTHFLNLRVRRYLNMDDTENLSHKEYTYRLWQSGWVWIDTQTLDPYDEYDDERTARIDFLSWYSW